MTKLNNIHNFIKQLRKEKGYSQEVLSKRAKIGRSHLTMIEGGRLNPSNETLEKILIACDYTMSEAKNLIAEWKVESALKEADNPSVVISNVVAGDNSILITGNNNAIGNIKNENKKSKN